MKVNYLVFSEGESDIILMVWFSFSYRRKKKESCSDCRRELKQGGFLFYLFILALQ